MLRIGLTGGIGSGKSKVADFFQQWGAAVVDTDAIAHQLTTPGGRAIEPLRRAFGDAFIRPDGALDRARMREHVFREPAARHRLEAILHPMIGAVTNAEISTAQGCYLVVVVPLLVESGRWRDRVDRVCVIDCDPETQIRRVQQRSGLSREAVERIMAAQATREQRLAVADDQVLNDGETTLSQLEQRARAVHEFWCAQPQRLRRALSD